MHGRSRMDDFDYPYDAIEQDAESALFDSLDPLVECALCHDSFDEFNITECDVCSMCLCEGCMPTHMKRRDHAPDYEETDEPEEEV